MRLTQSPRELSSSVSRIRCAELARLWLNPIMSNIDEDKAAAQRVEQWNNGNRTIPTLDINGTILTNPTPGQLRRVLGLQRSACVLL